MTSVWFLNLYSSKALRFPCRTASLLTPVAETPRKATVLSFRLSAADSLKETPFRKCDPICTGTVGSSHCMGCGGVCRRPVCCASASLQQPCERFGEERRGDPRHTCPDTWFAWGGESAAPQLPTAPGGKSVPVNWLQLPLGSGGNQLSLHIHSGLSFPELFYKPAKKLFCHNQDYTADHKMTTSSDDRNLKFL